ncbi:MAG: hypothetical protein U1E73_12220 [Planctomycetota bacterium]
MRRPGVLLAVLTVCIALAIVLLNRNGDDVPVAPSAAPVVEAATQPAAVAANAQRDAAPMADAPPTPPDAKPSLEVHVVDGDASEPVADATVAVFELRAVREALEAAHTTSHEPEGRRVRDRVAIRATTDEHGEARLAVPEHGLMVEARRGGRWGILLLGTLPENGVAEVALGPDRELHVQVVDAGGAPQSGVPVAVRRLVGPAASKASYQATTTEPPNGIAVFPHLQRILDRSPGWHATFAFPCVPQPCVPVDIDTPNTPPPQLVLPATGSLRVVVRDPMGGVCDASTLSLAIAADAGGEPQWQNGSWSRPAFDEKGEARVPFLGLGLALTVALRQHGRDITSKSLPGPRTPGEVVTCELCSTGDAPLARGRFVHKDGTPWPACKVRARPLLEPFRDTWSEQEVIAVDGTGRFALPVRVERPANGSRRYQISGELGDRAGAVTIDLPLDQDVPAAGIDLGDVVLDHGPLLLAGTVVDGERRPLADATVFLHTRTKVRDRDYWPRLQTSGLDKTGADGHFAVYLRHGGKDPGLDLKLTATCTGFVTARELPQWRGDDHAVVLLQQAGSIAGSLRFADGKTPPNTVLLLKSAGIACSASNPDSHGEFDLEGLAAGVYSLQVNCPLLVDAAGKPQPLTIDGLEVRAGETCRDPRLQGLRVEPALQSVRITIVDRAGKPLQEGLVNIAGTRGDASFRADGKGVCTVCAPVLPVDLEVTAFGCRVQHLQAVSGDTRVELDPGIEVRLRAGTKVNGTSPYWHLAVDLYGVRADGGRGERTYGDAFPWDRQTFDADGELALRLPGPGTYTCRFRVYVDNHGVGCGGMVAMDPPPRFTVVESDSPQVFELNVPTEAVAAAVAKALQ